MNKTLLTLRWAALALPLALSLTLIGCKDRPADAGGAARTPDQRGLGRAAR